ncbi:MAG TPA: VWA domain-containing protein [Terriglobales bacterium]|nr:VWA domain-containing protein [Terriglobales bacterium]
MRRLFRLFGCLGLAALAAAAQQKPARQTTPAPDFTFRANVGEVLVQANVTDKKGRSVDTLPATDFTVYENGVRQKVDSFSHDDAPVSVGILVDNSGSMRPKRIQVDQAALNFVRASNPQDDVFIVKFNDEYHLASPFTSSIPALEKGLGEIDPQAGTALYDAVINAVAYLNKYGTHPKKVLLLITDGQDDASSHDLQQTMHLLQSQNAPLIYCIGLVDKEDGKSTQRESQRVLLQFADSTGGLAYFPKSLEQVDGITRKVARDIRLQYSLLYHSNQTGAGYRDIKLEVNDPHVKHLSAQTRKGYFASGN